MQKRNRQRCWMVSVAMVTSICCLPVAALHAGPQGVEQLRHYCPVSCGSALINCSGKRLPCCCRSGGAIVCRCKNPINCGNSGDAC